MYVKSVTNSIVNGLSISPFIVIIILIVIALIFLYLFIIIWSWIISEIFIRFVDKLSRQGIRFKFIEYSNKTSVNTNVEVLNENEKNTID